MTGLAPMPAQDPALARLLSQMADIHEPSPIGFWPPAPGWIALGVILFIAVALLAYLLIRRYRRNAYRRFALARWRAIEPGSAQAQTEAALSLLKRICHHAYPDRKTDVNRLDAQAFGRWLNQLPKGPWFDEANLAQFAAFYGPEQEPPSAATAAAVERFIRQHPSVLKAHYRV
jgi:hypothetical protein